MVKSGQQVKILFTTSNPTTGAAADASSTPTGTLYVNAVANGATVTVANITTGVYSATVTLPSLSAGDIVSLRISATVSSVAGEACVWQDVGDTVRMSDTLTANPASGGITSSAFASGAITSAAIAADAITDAKVASDVTIASVTGAVGSVTGNVGGNVVGSVGSVTGAVGSVTGNVGGNVTGSVGSVASGGIVAASFATDSITSAAIAADAIGASELAADAVTEIAAGISVPTTAAIADAVWDEATSGHSTAGTTGKALTDAGAAGDPLSSAVPGSYASGTAGYQISRIGAAGATVTTPVTQSGDINIKRGDDYHLSDSRQIAWTISGAPSITGATVVFKLQQATQFTAAMTVTSSTSAYVQLTSAQTAGFTVGTWAYEVQATLATSSRIVTLVEGSAVITGDL